MIENQEEIRKSIKPPIVIFVSILILLVLAFLLVWIFKTEKLTVIKSWLGISTKETVTNETPNQTIILDQPPPADWQTFSNSKYRFSFKFPPEWQNQAFVGKTEDDGSGYSVYDFVTKNSDIESIQKIGAILPEKYFADSNIYTGTDFSQWADTNAGNCNADGPCAHASCNQTSDKTFFKTTSGLTGYVYHVIYKVESCIDGPEYGYDEAACSCEKTESVVGPIYILDTFSVTNGTLHLIRIAPDILDSDTIKVTDDIWQKIVNSITFY